MLQTDILWERPKENLKRFAEKLEAVKQPPDLIILPEMFATGFSMNAPQCAEDENGPSLLWMQEMAQKHQSTVCGSVIIKDHGLFYNRLFWVSPGGEFLTYNKRHLFRFANEHQFYTAGDQRMIVSLQGWKILPLVCYDLRFPVWSRNTFREGQYEYDCLIYIANWPERRALHWQRLLAARAIENMSYSIGLNRTGNDGNNIAHSGNSLIADPQGKVAHPLKDYEEGLIEFILDHQALQDWRTRFNMGQDWDAFEIK